ncbi:MAG: TRAP transporter small permease subunit [Rhodospirillales bacterium]|nr:TRAP transporter small permease subunit [Rhodospirillales bacterium]
MTEGFETTYRPTDKVGRVLYKYSAALAIFGSFIIGFMGLSIAVSVIGRATGIGSISGIYDLIEIWTCTAIFAVLPYCQLTRENVIVDFILTRASTRMKAICDAAGSLIFLLIGILLTWRLIYGGIDMYNNNESFTTIGFPRWLSFPYATLCMTLLIVVCFYTLARSISEARANKFIDDSLNRPGPEIHGEH